MGRLLHGELAHCSVLEAEKGTPFILQFHVLAYSGLLFVNALHPRSASCTDDRRMLHHPPGSVHLDVMSIPSTSMLTLQ